MSGLQRAIRHPDRINDPHVRAHTLASEALLGPLDPPDAAWLDEHLSGCDPCAATAGAFAEDAELLRGLRMDAPVAPRDLGARVSLALDEEVRRARRGRSSPDQGGRAAPGRAFRRPGFAFAGLAAVAVVALLVAPLAVPLGAPPAGTPPAGSLAPAATPIIVDSQPVAWVRRAPDGTYVLASAEVRRVCPGADATACGTLDGGAQTLATLSVKPSSVLLSTSGGPAVVVGQNAVYAVAVDIAAPVTTPGPEPSPVATSEPVQSPAASGEPTSPPVGSPSPSGSSRRLAAPLHCLARTGSADAAADHPAGYAAPLGGAAGRHRRGSDPSWARPPRTASTGNGSPSPLGRPTAHRVPTSTPGMLASPWPEP